MRSRHPYWRGTLGRVTVRLIALVTLTLALAAPLALGVAPTASARGASCGAATSGCGPMVCAPITPADYTTPATSPRGGVRARLNRTSGVSGSTDTLTGAGWPAFATVEIFLGELQQGGGIWTDPTAPIAQGLADTSGHVTIAGFRTPQVEDCTTRDGQHLGDSQALFIAQTPDGKARISLLFTYFPDPVLRSPSPSQVVAGEQVSLSGSGWEPGQKVTITPAFQPWPANGYPPYDTSSFQPLPGDAFTVTALRDGNIITTAIIPQKPQETQITFFATANSPRSGDISVQVDPVFSVLPTGSTTLTLSRDAAYAGATVTVTGTNWPTGQDILIAYCRGQAPFCRSELSEQLALVQADANGRITATVRIPTDARPGPITIQANPLTSPFDITTYAQTQPFEVQYPFAQAHPRLEFAIRALPYAIAALVVALIALGVWLVERRRRGPTLAARQ